MAALEFFNTALEEEMTRVRGISKRVHGIVTELRPFASYEELISALGERKGVHPGLVKAYLDSLDAEAELERILADCSQESFELTQAIPSLLLLFPTSVNWEGWCRRWSTCRRSRRGRRRWRRGC